jgi:hypothetical protein
MMTPKDKAEQLVDLYYPLFTNSMAMFDAKKCALIAVDTQISLLINLSKHIPLLEQMKYLQEVKREIEKL